MTADLRGRRVLITGATGGLGFETALVLAGAGARVTLSGRSDAKGAYAIDRIRAVHPAATVAYAHLDLASLASVTAFAEAFGRQSDGLDVLINNAGVMAPARRYTTADGFELQLATNYLGHFALIGLLLPLLLAGDAPRVVSLSSVAHRLRAKIRFDDLHGQRRYSPIGAYGQSKLAILLFAFELQRRIDASGSRLASIAAHPGYARTDLQSAGPRMGLDGRASTLERVSRALESRFGQSAADGARAVLYAATAPDAEAGGYYGPRGPLELKGSVGRARIGLRARSETTADELWRVSETITNVTWAFPAGTEPRRIPAPP